MTASHKIRIYNDLIYLYYPFQREISDLLLAIRQNQLPFIIYETFRTPFRQKFLNKERFCAELNPYKNAHVNGLAVDFLLDRRVMRDLNSSSAINNIVKNNVRGFDVGVPLENETMVFDIGTNTLASKTNPSRTIVQDQRILDVWNNLGKLINNQFPNLRWGGDRDKNQYQLIGADPTHVEYKDTKMLMRNKVALSAAAAKGAPGIKRGDLL
jgi:hypothetical protein